MTKIAKYLGVRRSQSLYRRRKRRHEYQQRRASAPVTFAPPGAALGSSGSTSTAALGIKYQSDIVGGYSGVSRLAKGTYPESTDLSYGVTLTRSRLW
jgi:hypothetical protein